MNEENRIKMTFINNTIETLVKNIEDELYEHLYDEAEFEWRDENGKHKDYELNDYDVNMVYKKINEKLQEKMVTIDIQINSEVNLNKVL